MTSTSPGSSPFRPRDCNGEAAVVGRSSGRWTSESDFVFTEEGGSTSVRERGRLGFLRNWPDVYNSSKVLKSLIGKKGLCAGKMVSVVGEPSEQERAAIHGLEMWPLQSAANAMRVETATGMAVVRGWAVYEQLERPTSAAFAAERYWWNLSKDGTWVDFTPHPEDMPELLLAEARAEQAPSEPAVLAAEE
eukprot:TRINITY_DN30842_c0_g1_i1.p1 TRINITY_DN30842_c0_g1~~TRINITY_DN30842_c0_g1_i1.p1  ORF type:complete len:191 (-),score=46.89 TRINITY_DN30842_c0_g1_i1:108-680(-)